ncbi:hypothetical protein L6164_029307 [Bauhinia variegata]|uniref:Uncharacterized protein n=1 Tax=Bauhinia variegata TaxID=167791 RepID=A0ACB9L8P4_BAUVA|nr:hypothetical protein L6164_029307 [Bauhinia variegata]
MAIVAASSMPSEGICCSTSFGITKKLTKSPLDRQRVPFLASRRFKSPFVGPSQFLWLSMGHSLCLSKVCVAADYSDSIPDSSSYTSNQGYHPLEELKVCHNSRQTTLSSAEIARTTIEANRNALLVFPGTVHCEPHEQISWAEFQYLIDDYGDIYFEIFDAVNILEDRGASNPVNALIGMDIPIYGNQRVASDYNILNLGSDDELPFDDDYDEVMDPHVSNAPVNWGVPDVSDLVHPIYFAKCLTRAINMECKKSMDHPSNGVSIVGYLRPAFADEESSVRMAYHSEDGEGYNSDSEDGKMFSSNSRSNQRNTGFTLYRLEILKIELFSVYGYQCEVDLLEFQDAEPDILVHSTSAILDHVNLRCDDALKALCKKKGLNIEGASLIGVDSLGMDVRVFSGVEVRTHRFPFKVPATSDVAAEKQIQQLLFPRSRRKRSMNSWRRS